MGLLLKLTGFGLLVLGIAIVFFSGFPEKYQKVALFNAGVLIGIILMGLGLLLIKM